VPSYYESFGLVPLEALACGTPVVAADIGEVKKFILPGKTGCVVRTNMPQNLAHGIRQVMNHHPYTIEAALAVRKSVRRYSWENVAGGIIREFNSVLAHWLLPVA
jgi:glycosyltransferase involved in cell wall biosynthesis